MLGGRRFQLQGAAGLKSAVIASEAKQSMEQQGSWIASSLRSSQ
jgi:hypothetical protein